MTPLCGVPAAAALATDKAELSAEEAKLKSEDNALIALDSKEMTDEIALKKAQDAVLSAMQKGDDKLVKELEAKVKALEGTAAADAKAKKALLAEARTLGCKRRRGGGRSAPVAALGQASGTASAPGPQGAQRSPLPFFPLQVSKEADLVKADKAKVSKDLAIDAAAADKKELEDEEKELASVVGGDTFAKVSKFFKQ